MRNGARCIKTVLALVGFVFALSAPALCVRLAMATGESSGGGGGTDREPCSGSTVDSPNFPGMIQSTTNTVRYNCCGNHVKCPRWIKGSISDFQAAWAIRRDYPGNPYEQNVYDICTNPSVNTGGYVVWMGLVDTYWTRNGRMTWIGNFGLDNNKDLRDSDFAHGYTIGQGFGELDQNTKKLIRSEEAKKGAKNVAFACEHNSDPDNPPPTYNLCDGFGSGETTSVLAMVQNASIQSGWKRGDSNNDNYVWAKPNDLIQFHHCYYGGVQSYADRDVTKQSGVGGDKFVGQTGNGTIANNASRAPLSTEHGPLKTIIPFENKYTISGVSSATRTFNVGTVVRDEYEGPSVNAAGITQSAQEKHSDYVVSTGDIGTDGSVHETITSGTPSAVAIQDSTPSANTSWTCNHWESTETKFFVTPPGPTPGEGWEAIMSSCDATLVFPGPGCNYTRTTSGDSTCRLTEEHWYTTTGPVSSNAYVKVPHNYINYGVSGIDSQKVYAGEIAQISARIVTEGRSNGVTQGYYATRVPNARWSVLGYISNDQYGNTDYSGNSAPVSNGSCVAGRSYCAEFASGSGTLNSGNSTSGDVYNFLNNQPYSVWDVEAGKYFCVATSVYPSATNGDMDISGGGNGEWSSPAVYCEIIHKKPTFQVWGGDIFTNGGLKSNTPTKNNVFGYSQYPYLIQNSTRVHFEGFGEHNVLAQKKIQGVFSGNASGFANSGTTEDIGLKGNCAHVPLSFANGNCADTGNSGISSGTSIYDSIMTQFGNTAKNKTTRTGTVDISNTFDSGSTIGGTNVRYTHVSSTAHIIASTFIPAQTSHIVYADGNLVIDSNLLYNDGLAYTEARQVPQLIVIAAGNIEIRGDVTQIDGWLLSKGEIITGPSQNQQANSASMLPLRINGPVYAQKIKLYRAYGATKGSGSGNPAEVMNYSPFVYLYNANRSTDTPTLYTTYLKEVAPRY